MPRYNPEWRATMERTLPPSAEVRSQVKDYMARTGLNEYDFAHRLGYSRAAIYAFLRGTYATNVERHDFLVRKNCLDFMAAHPVVPQVGVDGLLYETQNVKLIRQAFYDALDNGAAYYFRGAPGTQKSFVFAHLIAELNRTDAAKNGHGRRAYYIYSRERCAPGDFMKRIAEAAGVPSVGNIDRLIRNLRFDFSSRRVLLVFDEAQHIDRTCLEIVRELLDRPPRFGMLFGGSHQIEEMFDRMDMQQWHRRVRRGERLPGISEEEARTLIIPGELGKVSRSQEDWLVKESYDIDRVVERDGGGKFRAQTHRYISAGRLFDAIALIKRERSKKAEQ